MKIGSRARVVLPQNQGAKFKNQEGLVLDCTRSLANPFPLVYFLQFAELPIRAWFAEQQLVEVKPSHSDEDDPAA